MGLRRRVSGISKTRKTEGLAHLVGTIEDGLTERVGPCVGTARRGIRVQIVRECRWGSNVTIIHGGGGAVAQVRKGPVHTIEVGASGGNYANDTICVRTRTEIVGYARQVCGHDRDEDIPILPAKTVGRGTPLPIASRRSAWWIADGAVLVVVSNTLALEYVKGQVDRGTREGHISISLCNDLGRILAGGIVWRPCRVLVSTRPRRGPRTYSRIAELIDQKCYSRRW